MKTRMWLKSIFLSTYLTYATVILLFSIWKLIFTQNILYLFLGLSSLPILLFMIFLFNSSTARTSANLPIITLPTISFSIITIWIAITAKLTHPIILSTFLSIGIILYVYWYSRFKNRKDTPLKLNETLPKFELEYSDGTTFKSEDSIGHPNLFIFYRGNWCPLCMAQIKEVVSQYQKLEQRGVSTYLISSQSHDNTKELADKFSVNFNFMVDKDNKAAKKLNIDAVGGTPAGLQTLGYSNDTAMPTVILTDKEGTIIFLDLTDNYRVRPNPKTFLDAFDAAGVL